jgi:hypothetical protein
MPQPLHWSSSSIAIVKFGSYVFKWPEDDHVMVETCSHTLTKYNEISRVGDN